MNLLEFKAEAGQRLKHFITLQGISQSVLAKKLNISAPTLSKVVSGGGGMSSELVYGISKEYPELRWDWVYKGTGGMLDESISKNGVDQSGNKGVNVAYSSGNNNGNQYTNSGDRITEAELQSCKAMLAEKDKMIEELRQDKERLQSEKNKFWELLQKMIDQ